MEQFVITNALVYTGHRFAPREVYVENGRVAQLAKKVNAPADCPRLDLGGKRLVPGFIDIHTHGAAGVDVNAATTEQLNDLTRDQVAEFLIKRGEAILDAKEDSDLDSLFRAGGTSALLSQVSGLDDFQLVCFLVIR